MTALLQRREALASRLPLALLVPLCASAGLAAGISPKYGLMGAIAVVFVVAAVADLTLGVAVFTALSFLDILNGGAVNVMKVAGLVLFFSWFVRAAVSRRASDTLIANQPGVFAALVAFLAWSTVSIVWATDPGTALAEVARDILVILLVPIVFGAIHERRDVVMIVAAFVVGAAFSAVYGIVHPVAVSAQSAGRLTGGLGDPNEEASVLVAAIVLAVGLAFVAGRSTALKLTALISAALAFIAFINTGSRGGLVAFGCVLVGAFVFGGRWRRFALPLIAAVAVGVVGYIAVLAPGSTRERVTSTDTSGRNDLWTIGVRMFEAHPITGVGAGNFPNSSVDYLQRPGLITAASEIVDTPKVAHNIYLEELATLGVPGLLLLVGILLSATVAALRAAHIFERIGERDLELLSRCVVLALIAMMSANFFISDLVSKQLWLVIGLGLAMFKLAQSRQQAAPARR